MQIYLKRTISAGHRLENKEKDEQWNKKTFGKCFESIHGHNFICEIWVKGCINSDSGMVVNFNCIKDVVDRYDHKNLNDVLDEIPTAENLAMTILFALETMFVATDVRWVRIDIKIWETDNACVEDFIVNEAVF